MVSASFGLHHVPTGGRKAALYKRCFASLRPGGLLVSADCYLAADGKIRRRDREAWLDREIELLKDAGFSVEVTWRKDSFAVLVGLK